MDQLRKVLATIQKQLGGMTTTHKLLLGSLAVIMVMTLFLVSQYAGKPAMAPVWPGQSAEDQQRAVAFLTAQGYKAARDDSGMAVVPVSQQTQAQAALAQANQQPANSELIFDNIVKTQNWINSKEQNRQIYKVMRDKWLSGVIGKFRGVASAQVFIDAPEQTGFGTAARPAKASVTLFAAPGAPLGQETVDAAAKTVAGSVAGLDIERVSVIDGSTGRPCKVRTDGDLSGEANRESARAIERQFEQKLSGVLSYIDGVMVAVTATVDTTRQRIQTTKNLPTGEGTVVLPKKETSSSTTEGQSSSGAEPGVRSNAFADINAGGGKGNKSEQRQEETEYTSAIGVERKEIDDPRGMPTRLAATITVPRGFVIGLLRKEAPAQAGSGGTGGAAPAAPTEKEIQDRFDKEKVGITQAAQVHLKTVGADGVERPGDVAVLLASGEGMGGGGGGGADAGAPTLWRGAGAGGSGNGGSSASGSLESIGRMWTLGGGVVDRAVLAVLAVIAIGMMLMMVRKAGRRSDMPSAEELVGLPPALDAKSDLVGEADETETAMAGIEVGEEEIKATKMRESVSEFIKKNPDSASKLLNRWIAVEH